MRAIRKLLGLSTPKAQNTSLLEPVSLAAFGQMSGSQQSMLAKRWSPRPTNAESWTKRRNALPETL